MYGIFRMATPLKSAFRRGVTNRRLLSPAASRYVSGNGNTEKVASCLVKPFTSHLNIVEEQRALSAAKSIKLEEDKSKSVDSWYRKGALERFVGFVGTKGSSHQSSSNSGVISKFVSAEEEDELTEFSIASITIMRLFDVADFLFNITVGAVIVLWNYWRSIPKEQEIVMQIKNCAVHLWADVSGCDERRVTVFMMGRKCTIRAVGVAHCRISKIPQVRSKELPLEFNFDPRQAKGYIKSGMLHLLFPYSECEIDLMQIGQVSIPVVKVHTL